MFFLKKPSLVKCFTVCRQLQDGVAAIFGPMSRVSAAHVQSICNHMEVPHIQSKIDHMDGRKEGFYSHSINLSPDQQTLGAALKDLVKTFGWTEFTILYEDNKGYKHNCVVHVSFSNIL